MGYERRGEWIARADRRGDDGYVGALVLPTRYGQIVLTAEVPAGAIRRARSMLRSVHNELHRELRSGASQVEGIDGPDDLHEYVAGELVGCVPYVGEEVGLPILAALGPGIARAGASLLGGLLGGQQQPQERPASLPAAGTNANRARLLNFVGVRPGMDFDEVRARLTRGASQGWHPDDTGDAQAMLAALPTQGRVGQVATLAAQLGVAPREIAPAGPQAPQSGPVPTSTPSLPTPSLPGLAAALGGALPADLTAQLLGAGGTLAQAQQLAAGPGARALFGDLQGPVAGLVRTALRSVDATAARDIGDPAARDALARARETTEARVANALRMVDSLLGV